MRPSTGALLACSQRASTEVHGCSDPKTATDEPSRQFRKVVSRGNDQAPLALHLKGGVSHLFLPVRSGGVNTGLMATYSATAPMRNGG